MILKNFRNTKEYWLGRVQWCKYKLDLYTEAYHRASDAEDSKAMKSAKNRMKRWQEKLDYAQKRLQFYD